MTWFPQAYDNFVRADTSIGTIGTPTTLQNGASGAWTDFDTTVTGGTGVFQISNNMLKGTPHPTSNAYLQSIALRPASNETFQEQKETIRFGPGTSATKNAAYVVLRWQNPTAGSAGKDYYLLGYEVTGFIRIYALSSGSVVGGAALVSGGMPYYEGNEYFIVGSAQGKSPTTLTVTVYNLTRDPDMKSGVTISTTDNTAAMQGTGRIGFAINNLGNGSPVVAEYITEVQTYYGYALTLSPNSGTANGSTVDITATGSATTWLSTPPAFTSSAGSVSNIVVIDDVTATFKLHTSSTPTAYVITDNSTNATAVYRATALVDMSDSHIKFSPYNSYVNGGKCKWINPGAYFKCVFTGSYFQLQMDFTGLLKSKAEGGFGDIPTGQLASFYPKLWYCIDNGIPNTVSLASASNISGNTYGITLIDGTLSTAHSVEVILEAIYTNGDVYDLWNNQYNSVVLTGIKTDGALTTLPTTPSAANGATSLSTRPYNLLVMSDSIGNGYGIWGTGNPVNQNDAYRAFSSALGRLKNAETGNVSFNAWGYNVPGQGNVPVFTSAWNYYYSGQLRTVNGLLSPAPDWWVVMLGTNDAQYSSPAQSDATTEASIATFLSAARSAAPNASIYIVIPVSGAKRTAIATAVQLYQQSTQDTKIYSVDMGTILNSLMPIGMTWNTNSTNPSPFTPVVDQQGYDGIHPRDYVHTQIAGRIYSAMSYTPPAIQSSKQVLANPKNAAGYRMLGENFYVGLDGIQYVGGGIIYPYFVMATVTIYDSTGSTILSETPLSINASNNKKLRGQYLLQTGSGKTITSSGTYRAVFNIKMTDQSVFSWEQVIVLQPRPY